MSVVHLCRFGQIPAQIYKFAAVVTGDRLENLFKTLAVKFRYLLQRVADSFAAPRWDFHKMAVQLRPLIK